jgi:membrane-associated phospholipid phosphatase
MATPMIQMKSFILLLFSLIALHTKATLLQQDTIPSIINNHKQWIVPATIFSTGVMFATVPPFHKLEKNINLEIKKTGRQTEIDQATQFLPAVAVFALDAVGLKSSNTLSKQIQLLGASQLSAALIVYPMKTIIKRPRPNGADNRSFPSGHAARAFVSAEFLHQEFGHLSPWISIAGYTTASATAYLRLYQNEHWLGDVLAGAAIGMASTKLVYWINKRIVSKPKTQKELIAAF